MSHGYYAVLGVSSDASPEVIKKAYYGSIRKHPPEKDPSGNQKVREAYEVLKDPSQRKEYDAQSLYGEELSRLWELAQELHENKKYEEEAKALKRILIISEDNSQARIKLSRCYLIDGFYDEAIKVAQSLIKRSPENSFNWFNLGFIFEVYADHFSPEDNNKSNNYNEARNNYNKAVKMDLGKCQYYMAIARCFAEERKWTNAFLWAEKAIDSHKKTSSKWPDIDALFYPLDLCLKSRKLDKVLLFAQNIQKNIPDESDSKSYASQRFCKYGLDLFKSNNYKAAFYFLKSALLFDPSNQDLNGFCTFVNSANDAMGEVDLIEKDENIIWPIKAIVAAKLQLDLKFKTEEELDGVTDVAYENLGKFSEDAILNSIDSVQTDYPGHWIIAKQSLFSIKEIINKNRANRKPKPEPEPNRPEPEPKRPEPNPIRPEPIPDKPEPEQNENKDLIVRYVGRVLVFGIFFLVSLAYKWGLFWSGTFGIFLFVNIMFLTYQLTKDKQ